jgi:hypothetical protein
MVINKWMDILIAIAGALVLSYGLLQTQEVRIDRTERDLNKVSEKVDRHLLAHEEQNQELLAAIAKLQTDVQVILTKIQMQEK